MNVYDVKRLALVLSVQSEIEGMKAANSQSQDSQPYTMDDFENKSSELQNLAYVHDEQL